MAEVVIDIEGIRIVGGREQGRGEVLVYSNGPIALSPARARAVASAIKAAAMAAEDTAPPSTTFVMNVANATPGDLADRMREAFEAMRPGPAAA